MINKDTNLSMSQNRPSTPTKPGPQAPKVIRVRARGGGAGGAGGGAVDGVTETELSLSNISTVGSGSFGTVYKCTMVPPSGGKQVAVKKVLQDRRYKNRELQIMLKLHHTNVVTLLYYYYTQERGRSGEVEYLNVILEYMPDTLYSVIREYRRERRHVPIFYVKLYAYQLCRAVAYIHVKGICHRDIKPQNILVNHELGLLHLADFGSAKQFTAGEPNVSYICSRYYRAPELCFNATQYTVAVDVWSAGCCVGEMALGYPLFPGESSVNQIIEIIKVLGTPSSRDMHDMNPSYEDTNFPVIRPYPWARVFRSNRAASPDFLLFIGSLLTYSPVTRVSAWEALRHAVFDELREEGTRLPTGGALPDLFTLTADEVEAHHTQQ